jgi:hypothetical protein
MVQQKDLTANVYVTNARRLPDWRWREVSVREAARKGRGSRREHTKPDEFVRRAIPYVTLKHSGADILALRGKDPNLFEADRIYDECGNLKWGIEAMIMANQTPEYIAAWVGSTAEVMELYERMFFDVRGMLKHDGYVKLVVLDGAMVGNVSRDDPDKYWKLVGYVGGHDCLQQLLHLGKLDSFWQTWFNQAARSQFAKNRYAAELGRTVNRFTERHIGEQGILQDRVDMEERQMGVGGNEQQQATEQMLTCLTFTVGSVVDKQLPDRSEPRADQMIFEQIQTVTMEAAEPPQLPGTAEQEQS